MSSLFVNLQVRTPLTPRDSIQLVKKHYSQPQPGGLDRLHHLNVPINMIASSTQVKGGSMLSSILLYKNSERVPEVNSLSRNNGKKEDLTSLDVVSIIVFVCFIFIFCTL